MNLDYFSTLAGVSATVISIIMAFYAGYIVYLRQQRDKYREMLVKEFQDLDRLISEWSILRESPHPEWVPPVSKYIEILSKENWKNSIMEVLNPYLTKVKEEYEKTFKEERKIRDKTGGKLVAGPALYLNVKFALRDLFDKIYREFPSPPGDYEISDGIPIKFKSFIRYDFPQNYKEFQQWKSRFDVFFQDIRKIYYQLRPIIVHLKDIHRESIEQTLETMEEIKRYGVSWAEKGLKESINLSKNEIKYYDNFFRVIIEMKYKVDIISDKIATYNSYTYNWKDKWKVTTILSLAGMAITGIILPLLALFYEPPYLELLGRTSGIGFGLTTLFAIFLIYKEIFTA